MSRHECQHKRVCMPVMVQERTCKDTHLNKLPNVKLNTIQILSRSLCAGRVVPVWMNERSMFVFGPQNRFRLSVKRVTAHRIYQARELAILMQHHFMHWQQHCTILCILNQPAGQTL